MQRAALLCVLLLSACSGAEPLLDSAESTDGKADATLSPLRDALVQLTSTCDPVRGSMKFKTDTDKQVDEVSICSLPGAFFWRADMDIDCDGGTSHACKADPDYQGETSATDSRGRPVDASIVPYIVVPLPSARFDYKARGIELGAVVAVLYEGHLHYGIFADEGPPQIVGEASAAMARLFGIPDDPVNGGTDDGDLGVTYVVFPGNDAIVSPIESRSDAIAMGNRKLAALIAATR